MKSKKLQLLLLVFFLFLFLVSFFFINYNKNADATTPPIEDFPFPFSTETETSSNSIDEEESSSSVAESETASEMETTIEMQFPQKSEIQIETSPTDRVTYQSGFYYEPINDSIKARINGLSYKEDCTVPYEELRYVSILHINFNGETVTGEIICNKAIAQDLLEIFYQLYEANYPIKQIRLIDEFNADDDLSCLENNTSCFNFRVVAGSTNLSKHALGLAIDINPFYNPYVTYPNGQIRISPPGSEPYADRNADFPYKIDEQDLCYQLFKEHGFTWGGSWKTLKDYQHFQKTID